MLANLPTWRSCSRHSLSFGRPISPRLGGTDSRGLVFLGERRWLAEHLRDISDAGAFATEKAGRIDKFQQLVGVLAEVALGPVAKGLGHARTEQGMLSCASWLSTVFFS